MSAEPTTVDRAKFHQMKEGTKEDWRIIGRNRPCEGTADGSGPRLLDGAMRLRGDRLTHSLQTATLALQDGRDDEYVVAALLHASATPWHRTTTPRSAPRSFGPSSPRAFTGSCSTTASSRATTSAPHRARPRCGTVRRPGGTTTVRTERYDQAAFDPAGETLRWRSSTHGARVLHPDGMVTTELRPGGLRGRVPHRRSLRPQAHVSARDEAPERGICYFADDALVPDETSFRIRSPHVQ